MSARLEVGGVEYLGADWAKVAELLARQEGVVPFEDLTREELLRIYEAGEWWRSDRRLLPGVSWLLDLVRGGTVDFFLFLLPRGVIGLEEGRLGEVEDQTWSVNQNGFIYMLADHQPAITLAFSEKELVHGLLFVSGEQHAFRRWPDGLRTKLLARVRQVRENMLTLARLASEAGIPRSLLWLRVSEDGAVTAPTCSTEEMGDDSVVLVVDLLPNGKSRTAVDIILPIFGTWLDLHKLEESFTPHLVSTAYCVTRPDSEEEVIGRFRLSTNIARGTDVLSNDCWKVLGPLAAVQRAFPELGTFVKNLHVLWKAEGGGVNWKESVVTVYGSEKAMRALAAVLGNHPDVFKVLIRESR